MCPINYSVILYSFRKAIDTVHAYDQKTIVSITSFEETVFPSSTYTVMGCRETKAEELTFIIKSKQRRSKTENRSWINSKAYEFTSNMLF